MTDKQKILLKFDSTVCFVCQGKFKEKDEIAILRNSSKLHKNCYDEIKKTVEEEERNV